MSSSAVGLPLHQPSAGPPPRDKLGEEWGRLAGLVAVTLGWGPEVFWAATPAELASVVGALAGEEVSPADGALVARLREAFPDG